MRVKEAKAVARQWVMEEAGKLSGFYGACYAGSTNWLPDEAVLPVSSDVDLWVILENPNPPDKLGKFIYRGVMLEVTYLAGAQFQTPEPLLGNYHLAGSFKTASLIADPSGRLAPLQAAVAREYAKHPWVYKRCEHARNKILENLQGLNASAPFHDQVLPWLFATGVMTHVLLVAGLKNPTVRRRYVAVRQLLEEYGHQAFYPTLLELLGCARWSRDQVEAHLAALTEVFDVTKTVIKTPFFFASDLTDFARPIAIEGSQEMIEAGYHREAIFWITATYSRCQKTLYHDAPAEVQARFEPGYRRLLAELGISAFADLQQRAEQVKETLPQVWQVAEAIIAANPEIEEK